LSLRPTSRAATLPVHNGQPNWYRYQFGIGTNNCTIVRHAQTEIRFSSAEGYAGHRTVHLCVAPVDYADPMSDTRPNPERPNEQITRITRITQIKPNTQKLQTIAGASGAPGAPATRKQVVSWAFWDWATQPFNTVILT